MCIVDGCFQFLAPAGRHVYSSASAPEERYVYSSDTLIVRAPEERQCVSYFRCVIVRIKNIFRDYTGHQNVLDNSRYSSLNVLCE